jgi:hypothetical protein
MTNISKNGPIPMCGRLRNARGGGDYLWYIVKVFRHSF